MQALGEAMVPARERRSAHNAGVVLRDLAAAIAGGGGKCVTDLGVVRGQKDLFGQVASESTAHGVIRSMGAGELGAIRAARSQAWEAAAQPCKLIVDSDATLLTAHSEKERAAGNYKGGCGFHPLLAYLEGGEQLAALLRPGNANFKTARDHFTVLERLAIERGAPCHVRMDSGSELTANALRDWCRFASADTAYIEPGSPWQNPWAESFNGKLRDELLDLEVFETLTEAKVLAEDFRIAYNTNRPHSALGMKAPARFAADRRRIDNPINPGLS